jgi:hypothetical protein
MSDGDGLQFDRAEYDNAPAQTECAECNAPLAGFYYDVNGRTVCEPCRYAVESRFTTGSAAGRLLRATGAGVVAAALGAGLYYAIAALTGYEFGLIAIVVGWAVGAAVNWGSNGRGGWAYQTLAIGLTYFAIVSTYIPPILEELRSANVVEASAAAGADPGAAVESVPPAVLTVLVIVIAVAAPFLGGLQNIIGLVIIGIGLYEAWKLNRRTELTISGPHNLARPAAAG